MAGLVTLMVVVSCFDGFSQCSLADKIRPYPAPAACEAQLSKVLPQTAQKSEYALGRCVPAPNLAAAAEETADKEIAAEMAWQVSANGDLLAALLPEAAADSAGDGDSPLYAENLAASGKESVAGSAVLAAARAMAAEPEEKSAPAAALHDSKLAFYRKYKSKKVKSRGTPPPQLEEAAASLAGHSPKYIYEASLPGQNGYYANAGMNIIWGSAAPLSMAAFEIRPAAEEVYSLPPMVAVILRKPDLAVGALPAQNYFDENSGIIQNLFPAAAKPAAAPAAHSAPEELFHQSRRLDSSGGGEQRYEQKFERLTRASRLIS